MLKLFFQKQQAIKKGELRHKKRLVQSRFLKITYIVLVATIILSSWQILRDPQTLPITQVQIKGNLSHVNKNKLKTLLTPYTNTGFFSVDSKGLRQTLLNLPWIAKVRISRVWPHQLEINITEKQPIARWGDRALLTAQGDIFTPPKATLPTNLPVLMGPKNQQAQVLALYQQLQTRLNNLNLSITSMDLSARQAVQLTLSNGIELILGKQDIIDRLQRFMAVYPKVFDNKANMVDYVDMRYTNGMAVEWKKNNGDGVKVING